MNDKLARKAGTIWTIEDGGQHGIVRLDKKVLGLEFASLDDRTIGLDGFRKMLGGALILGTRVSIASMTKEGKSLYVSRLT